MSNIGRIYMRLYFKNIWMSLTKLPLPYYAFGVLVVSIVILFFSGNNYETLPWKHYVKAHSGYYGSCCSIVLQNHENYFPLHSEAESNYFNVEIFNERSEKTQFNLSHAAAVDRMFVPFLSLIISQISLGTLNVVDTYIFLNIFLWLISSILMCKIALIFFNDRRAAYFSSLLTLCYPVYWLMMQSIG